MKKIMILDDDPVITTVYGKHFRAGGFEVEIAHGGRQGLAVVRRFRPDVVLLDLNMPDGSGVDWLREIRADPEFLHLPVLVLTAGTVGWQVSAASNSDVSFVFKRGAQPRDIVAAVNALLASAALTAPIPPRPPAAGGRTQNL